MTLSPSTATHHSMVKLTLWNQDKAITCHSASEHILLCHNLAKHRAPPQSGHQQTMLGEWKMCRCTQQSMKEEYTGLEPQTSITRTSPTFITPFFFGFSSNFSCCSWSPLSLSSLVNFNQSLQSAFLWPNIPQW